jgi:hypothetical protein
MVSSTIPYSLMSNNASRNAWNQLDNPTFTTNQLARTLFAYHIAQKTPQ